MGDRVTVEQAVKVAADVTYSGAFSPRTRTLARFVLQEHSGDRLPEGVTAEEVESIRAWAEASVNSTMYCGFFEDRQAAARYLLAVLPPAPPSEPPRPELPPKREGWVLTGEWRKAKAGEGYWSYWCSKEGRPAVATVDLTFHVYIALKVPAPPGPGWVVTKYEKPTNGARIWSPVGEGGWFVWNDLGDAIRAKEQHLYSAYGYPDGRRFIAEQEDEDDDRTRLAKQNYNDLSAVRLVIGSWDSISDRAKVPYLDAADLSLAAGVKAPDPVRLESL